MGPRITRFLVVLGSFFIVSVSTWTTPASAAVAGPIVGGFSAQVCAGAVCNDLSADVDATGALNANFNGTRIQDLALFPDLVFSGNVDPIVSGSFTLTNLSGATQSFMVSATLGLVPIFGLQSAFTDLNNGSCTDGDDNGCTVAVVAPFAPWLADYQVNGTAINMPRGDGVALPSPGGPYTDAAFGPVTGVFDCGVSGCNSMGFTTAFSLTAHDTVHYDFQFLLTPAVVAEPSTWSLLALSLTSLGLLARRRKQN